MSFVFAVLLLFLHVFMMLGTLMQHTAGNVRQRLGVYFYVKDAAQMNRELGKNDVVASEKQETI